MIKADNISKFYNNECVLNDVSIKIEDGEFVVILGPSGSGKSTLMNVLSGLEKPESGKVFIDEFEITSMSDTNVTAVRREKIGFIFQQYYLLSHLSVLGNIKMGADLAKNADFMKLVNALGLSDKTKSKPSELSGGEQQRVCIARALAKNPKFLFLDEPTGALDEKTGREVLDLICKLKKEQNFTIIMVTHNENIADMAETVVRMNSGKIVDSYKNKTQKTAFEIGWWFMIIGIKDIFKLFGISIVCFCAVFVCTFFLNYYLDVLPLRDIVSEQSLALFEAQIATSKFTSIITGVVLVLISVVMLIFYIKLYIDSHSKDIGILKAMGYSNKKIAIKFWVFGLSVFIGCILGYLAGHLVMPYIYKNMSIEGVPEIKINYHVSLLFLLVILPSVIFSGIACLYAGFALNRPVLELLRGKSDKNKVKSVKKCKERTFLSEMRIKVLSSKKSLTFFVAFACFCFSAMVQMGLSMENLTSKTMGFMILAIGLVLATTTMFMAITTLVNSNKKNIAMMKTFGYSMKECVTTIFAPYLPFAFLGFLIGTIYQYGLLSLMINVVFANVGEVPAYNFDVSMFFLTLALFVVCYLLVMTYYGNKVKKISVKEVMLEN